MAGHFPWPSVVPFASATSFGRLPLGIYILEGMAAVSGPWPLTVLSGLVPIFGRFLWPQVVLSGLVPPFGHSWWLGAFHYNNMYEQKRAYNHRGVQTIGCVYDIYEHGDTVDLTEVRDELRSLYGNHMIFMFRVM